MNDRHQIIEQLGSGGFGPVYRALDTQLNHEVAIRQLDLTSSSSHTELNQRLIEEAKILAALNHPNIVTIYDINSATDRGAIIMEFLQGTTLDEIIRKNPLVIKDFIFVTTQLLSALSAAHEHGVMHGDIKPGNIILSPVCENSYEVKLLDFGMSPSLKNANKGSNDSSSMLESINFMAPELLEGKNPDEESDLYSLGCLLYYMLTGFRPFDDESSVQIIASHITGNFTPLRILTPQAPEALLLWIEKHISKDPEYRHRSARESLNDLLTIDIKNAKSESQISHPNANGKVHKPSPVRISDLKFSTAPSVTMSSTNLETKTPVAPLKQPNIQVGQHQEEEFRKAKLKKQSNPTPQKTISGKIQRDRPDAIWYFTVKGEKKGPVSFEKLSDLVSLGSVKLDDSVWHPAFGQWQQVSEIKDFNESVARQLSRPRSETQIKSTNKSETPSHQAKNVNSTSYTEPQSNSRPIMFEFAIIMVGVLATAALVWKYPADWQASFLTLALVLILISMFQLRWMLAKNAKLLLIVSLIFPFFSDVIFATLNIHKSARHLPSFILGACLVAYTFLNRFPNDFIDFTGMEIHINPIMKYITNFITY